EEFFGVPDSLISKDNLFLQVANFTSHPVNLNEGCLLGLGHNPEQWLQQKDSTSQEDRVQFTAHSQAIKSMVSDLLKLPAVNSQDLGGEGQEEFKLSGGPKTAETSDPDPVPSSKLLSEIHFSPDLTKEQRKELEKVVLHHEKAFGLDGRLGHYNAKVQIPLREDAKEVSLPPFGTSPEKKQVI
ncbi:hypothetical protein BD410DRAFT_679745, partial [Rickenella mellea]